MAQGAAQTLAVLRQVGKDLLEPVQILGHARFEEASFGAQQHDADVGGLAPPGVGAELDDGVVADSGVHGVCYSS